MSVARIGGGPVTSGGQDITNGSTNRGELKRMLMPHQCSEIQEQDKRVLAKSKDFLSQVYNGK